MFDFLKKGKEKTAAKKSAAVRAEALENMRGARARLGEETIQEIAEILRKKDSSPMKQAEDQIKSFDKARVADNLKAMIDDK